MYTCYDYIGTQRENDRAELAVGMRVKHIATKET